MGELFEDHAVLERARLALVRVADDVLDVALLGLDKARLHPPAGTLFPTGAELSHGRANRLRIVTNSPVLSCTEQTVPQSLYGVTPSRISDA